MAINKKAIVFSLISILMSTLFILLYSVFVHVSIDEQSEIDKNIIQSTEYFLELFPSYFGSAVQESSYKSLKFLINESPIDDFKTSFIGCLQTGKYSSINCSLDGTSPELKLILNQISNQASEIYRGNCSVYIKEISVDQKDAFYLTVTAEAILYFNREDKLYWERNFTVSQKINLVGLPDPLFKLNDSTDEEERIIKQYESYFNYQSFEGNSSLFRKFLDEGLYFIDDSAPSFIEVMENNITNHIPKGLGLNSIIPVTLEGQNSYVQNRSFLALDYISGKIFDGNNLVLIDGDGLKYLNLTFYRPKMFDDEGGNQNMGFSEADLPSSIGDCHCDLDGCYCN